eukprot:CAMPEP_0172199400 /NCGR_PEP_ID=MMETSP1050-20130122/28669_1 /TAXON_ID=233186 /ORGANISM="Cryptomonas curvata, Strain CCAP979/52" /LENGTH=45 /DNA_ID= /DNA_START= /DNA_END= /DNA_ORIENTATION=
MPRPKKSGACGAAIKDTTVPTSMSFAIFGVDKDVESVSSIESMIA